MTIVTDKRKTGNTVFQLHDVNGACHSLLLLSNVLSLNDTAPMNNDCNANAPIMLNNNLEIESS